MQIPTRIGLHKASRMLVLHYGQESTQLSAEFLRVHSPSAEVQGHGQPQLQYGKQQVSIVRVEPVGRYAVRLVFDDGHDTGLYSWDYLEQLCKNQDTLWQQYLNKLHEAGKSRDPNTSVVSLR